MHEIIDVHTLEQVLKSNDDLAHHNAEHLTGNGHFTLNIMSAPGAGKTSLLSSICPMLLPKYSAVVIEGDMVGDLDRQRLTQKGITAFQISTGRSCHLDAAMIARFLHTQKLPKADFLFIENVGNLVCPAEFQLGEDLRIVLLSATEGDDKPLKYPVIFRNCDAVIFTKCDLLPYVQFDLAKAASYVEGLNPDIVTFAVSTVDGRELDRLAAWLIDRKIKSRKLNPTPATRQS